MSITPRSAGCPVRSIRPGSEVVTNWNVPFASVMRYVRALRAKPLRTWRVAIRGRTRTCGLDVVIAREGAHERRIGSGPARMQRTAVALGAGAVEDYLALLLKLVQLGIRDRGTASSRRGSRLASSSTPGEENSVCWKAARSSSMRVGGSTDTCACAKSAPRACS